MTEKMHPDIARSSDYFLRCDCEIVPEFDAYPKPVKVMDYHTYKRKQNKKNENTPAFSSAPCVHSKYNGKVIHSKNFPEADLVCDVCGKRYKTKTVVKRDLDSGDEWDIDDLNCTERTVAQSVTVTSELPDIKDKWRAVKDGNKLGIAESREEAKKIVQDQYPIQMDLDWTDSENKSKCMVDKGSHTGEYAHYKVEYTYV